MKRKVHAHTTTNRFTKLLCGARGGLMDLRNKTKIDCKNYIRVIKKKKGIIAEVAPDPRQLRFDLTS